MEIIEVKLNILYIKTNIKLFVTRTTKEYHLIDNLRLLKINGTSESIINFLKMKTSPKVIDEIIYSDLKH